MASAYNKRGKIWISLYQNGKRIRKSTGLAYNKSNLKKVEKELIPLLEEADLEKRKTIEEYYKILMQLKECKESTKERYDSLWINHFGIFKKREVNTITRSELKVWMANLNLSPKSVRLAVSLMFQIFNEAIDDEAIKDNPCKNMRLPKLKEYEPKPFSKEEMALLIENSNDWFRNLLGFLFLTGMRIGEVLALEWQDIQDDHIIVSKSIRQGVVSTTKTNKSREVPIFNDLRPFIKSQQFKSGLDKRVFPNLNGANDLRDKWVSLLKKCKLEHRVLYQTRHTFAINALDSGKFKVSFIANMLGHSVQMLFQKYAKFVKSERENIDLEFSTFRHHLGTKVV